MAQKVAIVSDPGIDGAFAVALALHDPRLDVLGLLATAGNIPAERATQNVQILLDNLDPPRLPRVGAAPAVEYDVDGAPLHGASGFGGAEFPVAPLHHVLPSEKLLVDLVRQNPHEVTVICIGPLTVLARAFDLYPETPNLVQRIVVGGGTLHEPGDAGPVSEFHFFCDPVAARRVVQCGAPLTLIPLDVMRKVLFAPTDLLGMPTDGTPAGRFLRQIVPFGIAATSSHYGVEGFQLKDVLGVAAVSLPDALHTRNLAVDVETRGELTRGMTVFDERPWRATKPNVALVHDVDAAAVRDYLKRVLGF
jgi:inosine-uridine nucleoside N-ribohydrolase